MKLILLAIVMFTYWTFIGYTGLRLLYSQRNIIRNLLVAPAAGLSSILLIILFISQCGLPIKVFAFYITVGLFISCLFTFKKSHFKPKKILIVWKHYLPFLSFLILGLILTGWPALEFGFDWMSYVNDDMTTYLLGAQRLLNNGFFEPPTPEDITNGSNYSSLMWFMHVPGMHRAGCDLIIAWAASVFNLDPPQVFMSIILALHLILISSAAALAFFTHKDRKVALLTIFLLIFSPLTSLSTLNQLIAQVGGLGLLAACCVFLLRDLDISGWSRIYYAIISAILVASLLVFYPEAFPFLILAFIVYQARQHYLKKQYPSRGFYFTLALSFLMLILFLNQNIVSSVTHLLIQTRGGLIKNANPFTALFPYYLTPYGLGALWGAFPIGTAISEPWLSSGILFSLTLLAFTFLATLQSIKKCFPSAIMTIVMLVLATQLFLAKNGFGLYKIAMFIQPFLLATLASFWLKLSNKILPVYRYLPLIALALVCLPSQFMYANKSRGYGDKSAVDVPDISNKYLVRTFKESIQQVPINTNLFLDTTILPLAKLQAIYLTGYNSVFPSRDFFVYMYRYYEVIDRMPIWLRRKKIFEKTQQLKPFLTQTYSKIYSFNLHKENIKNQFTSFKEPNKFLLVLNQNRSIFNKKKLGFRNNSLDKSYELLDNSIIKNHLIFTHSELGNHYYLGDIRRISLYQTEPDFFYPGQIMAGLGKHLLFRVINPTNGARFLINITATYKGDHSNALPHEAAVIGSARLNLPLVGRGSARIFSQPLSPQNIAGHDYVAIDMAEDGQPFPNLKAGLMNLFGKDINLDSRIMVVFGRDIAFISEEEYLNIKPPSALKNFPMDLKNIDLEYSGMYEDGWISEDAFFILSSKGTNSILKINGLIPLITDPNYNTELSVLIDGVEISRKILAIGVFDLEYNLPTDNLKPRVELHFSKFQHLPGKDGRPVAAKIDYLGFK